MKKTAKGVSVLFSMLLALVLFLGCPTGTDPIVPERGETDEGNDTPTVLKGALSDWIITAGYENGIDSSNFSISAATDEDRNCMKVIWSSDTDFRSCELYALLPNATEGTDYGVYDGIQFDVKLTASTNFLLLMRNPAGGTTVKIYEDYVYRGTDDEGAIWITVKKPFADATDTGWGTPALSGTLKEWLTSDKATQKQINLNPILNVGGGSALSTDQITYFDNIGFYSNGSDADDETDDVFTAIWDFE
jgi:hypothetical protein